MQQRVRCCLSFNFLFVVNCLARSSNRAVCCQWAKAVNVSFVIEQQLQNSAWLVAGDGIMEGSQRTGFSVTAGFEQKLQDFGEDCWLFQSVH